MANNNSDIQASYEEKLNYKLFALDNVDNKIDFWNSKKYYGKFDTFVKPIIPKATSLKKLTLLDVFKGLNEETKEKIFKNPEGFTTVFTETIKNTLADHIAEKIEYTLSEEVMHYDQEELFPPSRKFPQKELIDGMAAMKIM
jgi:restriction endonuclease